MYPINYRPKTPERSSADDFDYTSVKWAPKFLSIEYSKLKHAILVPREAYQKASLENNEERKTHYLAIMQAFQARMSEIERYCHDNNYILG